MLPRTLVSLYLLIHQCLKLLPGYLRLPHRCNPRRDFPPSLLPRASFSFFLASFCCDGYSSPIHKGISVPCVRRNKVLLLGFIWMLTNRWSLILATGIGRSCELLLQLSGSSL